MYKLMTLGALLVGLALAPVLSGGIDPEQKTLPKIERPAISASDQLSPTNDAARASARSCQWECHVCEAEQDCANTCTEIGECGSSCGFIMQCKPGQNWNESNCACE